MDAKPFLVAGERRTGEGVLEVTSPFDGSVVARVGVPTDEDVEAAIEAAAGAFEDARLLPVHERAAALSHVSQRLEERADEVAEVIAREGGKPLRWARVEASRAVATFRWAAEEARRGEGEVMRLDTEQGTGSRLGIVRKFPFGPVLGIAPFNFPVNLVAHKVAPAIAVGAPIIVKPATSTPLGALLLGDLVAETELPPGMISVLPVSGERAQAMAQDERIAKISFTGSGEVGWKLKALSPKKHFTLELGGNAGVIVHDDADLDHAAERLAFGGYYQAGQSCISAQRILVHRDVHDAFLERYVAEVERLVTGDPMDAATDVGPLIDRGALERIGAWVEEAVAQGARILTGGAARPPFYEPTILTDVQPSMKVCREEVFGPVTTVQRYGTFEEAIAAVNDSRYGLQAGVFTRSFERALLAHRDLVVGGVIVNDVSAYRADQMPYGGAKESGYGREGLRYAMAEMTEPRILVLSHVPL